MKMMDRARRLVGLLRRERQVPITINVPDAGLLRGKTALVTGGTGGIGLAICSRLLDCGASVVCAGSREESVQRSLPQLMGGSNRAYGVVLDVTNVASIDDQIEKVCKVSGGGLDILVNAAGIIAHTHFPEVTEGEWDSILDINAKGMFFVSQSVAKHMISHGVRGHILNVSSASALRPASTAYNVSKCVVEGMTKGMADELAPFGITVNAIAPGPTWGGMLGCGEWGGIDHPTNPMGRYAMPDEVAQLAVWLVSSASDLVVGNTVYITGGSGTISLHS